MRPRLVVAIRLYRLRKDELSHFLDQIFYQIKESLVICLCGAKNERAAGRESR